MMLPSLGSGVGGGRLILQGDFIRRRVVSHRRFALALLNSPERKLHRGSAVARG
jgi:hypothetical protein